MEQPDHIDELLRGRLYDAELKPPAFVWPNIESALRKRKRRFFLWLFTGLGLAFTGLAAVWLLRDIPDIANADSPSIEQSAETGMVAEKPAVSTRNTEAIAENTPASAIPEDVPADHWATKNTGSRDPRSGRTTLTAKGNGSAPESVDQKRAMDDGVAASPEKGKETAQTIPDPPAEVESPPAGTESAAQQTAASNPSSTPSGLAGISMLPPRSEPLDYSRETKLPATVPIKKFRHKKKDPKACYDFARHPTVWLADFYGGPSFAFKELNTNDPEYKDYLRQRLETESNSWAYNAGVRATLLFDRHFMLRTGLHYEQITEVFTYVEPNSIEIDITQKWNAMDGVWVNETTGVRYGEAYFKAYNRFGMLDIPLQAGMELRKGRTGVNINAGVSFNILFWKGGAILNTQGVPRYFTPGNVNPIEVFRSRTSLSAVGSIQWFYHIHPRLRIFAEPYYRQIVQPVTVQGYPIWQQYGVGGIRLGMTKIID